jgi:hypothetical protein
MEMVELHGVFSKGSVALRRGDLVWLKNSDENRVITFSRRSGSEEIVVAINMTNTPFTGTVATNGAFDEITPKIGNPLPPDDEKAKAATRERSVLPSLNLDAYAFRIFRRRL